MFTSTANRFRTLKPGDRDFQFSTDGITVVPRAGFEILQGCPWEYRMIIQECLRNGWLQPVAHMRDIEYTMELLRQ